MAKNCWIYQKSDNLHDLQNSDPRDFRFNINFTNKYKIVKKANGALTVSMQSSKARDIAHGASSDIYYCGKLEVLCACEWTCVREHVYVYVYTYIRTFVCLCVSVLFM